MPKKVHPSEVGYGKYKSKSFTWVAQNDIEFFKQIQTLYFSKYSASKKNNYRKVEKRFIQNQGLALVDRFKEEIYEIANLMRQKLTSRELRNHIGIHFKHIPSNNIDGVISDANTIIRKEFDTERNYLLDIHLVRYEQLYQENFKPDLEYVPPQYRKAVMCEHHITAMETLFQKEKLLGVHTKKFKLQANKTSLQRSDTDFDFLKVSSAERLELLSLLNKAKVVIELVRPVTNDNPLNVDTTSPIHIEAKIEAPIQQAQQTDIKGDARAQRKQKEGKTFYEVEQVIKKTLEEQVKELFEKKNKK